MPEPLRASEPGRAPASERRRARAGGAWAAAERGCLPRAGPPAPVGGTRLLRGAPCPRQPRADGQVSASAAAARGARLGRLAGGRGEKFVRCGAVRGELGLSLCGAAVRHLRGARAEADGVLRPGWAGGSWVEGSVPPARAVHEEMMPFRCLPCLVFVWQAGERNSQVENRISPPRCCILQIEPCFYDILARVPFVKSGKAARDLGTFM